MKSKSPTSRSVTGSRLQALRILRARFDRGVPLHHLFQDESFSRLSERDRAFCREIIDGVLRNLSLIDFWLVQHSSRPLSRLDPAVVWILRISLGQLALLRAPAYAVLDQAAGLCRDLRRSYSVPFVNGLLRSFLRNPLERVEGGAPEQLAVRFSHPEWLVRRWVKRYGLEEAKALLARNNTFPPAVMWVNPFHLSVDSALQEFLSDGYDGYRVESVPGCIRLAGAALSGHRLVREGACAFMDHSSQLVGYYGEIPEGNGWIGDLCAAPGGKAFILAARLKGREPVVGCDISEDRLRSLRRRAEAGRIPRLLLVRANLEDGAPFGRHFRFLQADVPCSGLGTIRSNPDLRWFVREEDLAGYGERQVRIVENGFCALEPGGELVYSTCSSEPEENEQVIERFLSRQSAEVVGEPLATFRSDAVGDGFYAVRIRRR